MDLQLEVLDVMEAPATWGEVACFVVGVGAGIAVGIAIT